MTGHTHEQVDSLFGRVSQRMYEDGGCFSVQQLMHQIETSGTTAPDGDTPTAVELESVSIRVHQHLTPLPAGW
jgi:hypothetical protein